MNKKKPSLKAMLTQIWYYTHMIEYPNYNKAIIISGDGDFYCLIEYLRDKNKLAHVVIPNPQKYSALLRKFRKYFVYISNLKNKLSIKKRGSNLRTKP